MVVVLTFDCTQVVVAGEELGFSLADIVNIRLVVVVVVVVAAAAAAAVAVAVAAK